MRLTSLTRFIEPLKNFLTRLVVVLFFLLKPCGRVLWFVFEWPVKLAPILIIGGYSAALWQVDNLFLEQAKKSRLSQNQVRTYSYTRHILFPTDRKYLAIVEQEAAARANMDRGKLVKAQFRFTLFALGNEIGNLLSHLSSYPYSRFGQKMLAIYDHVQFMPAEGIEAIIDGNWLTELDFESDFKNLDQIHNDYAGLATKEVDESLQSENQLLLLRNPDYRYTAAESKNRKTDDDDSLSDAALGSRDKDKQDTCKAKASKRVKDMEAEIKKNSPPLGQNDVSLDLKEFELNEYYQCLGQK